MAINGIEWVLIFMAALLLFGPKKLPELGRAIGKGIREFKSATNGLLDDSKGEKNKEEAVSKPANSVEPESGKDEGSPTAAKATQSTDENITPKPANTTEKSL